MTIFIAAMDMKNGKMTYTNGGHNFPFIVPVNESDERGPKRKKNFSKKTNINPISLKQMGNPIGIAIENTYEDVEIDIAPGDKVFLFTDGLIECAPENTKPWGRKKMIENVLSHSSKPAGEMQKRIVDQAFTFFDGAPLEDDITIVVVEVDKEWQPQTATQKLSA